MKMNYTKHGIMLSDKNRSEKSNRSDKEDILMYIINGIAYAGEQKPSLKVCGIRPLNNYMLWLRFNTGEEKIFDFKPLLDKPAFKPLKDTSIFNTVYIDYGVPVWNNGDIDIAPETVYLNAVSVSESPA